MNRINPTVAAVIAGILAILLAVYVFAGGDNSSSNRDKLSDRDLAMAGETPPDECASQQTLALLKSELFRRAAETRGSDQGAFEYASSTSQLRLTSAGTARQSRDSGTLNCSGAVTLELAPGLMVAGGSRALQAQLGYALQPSIANAGGLLTISNADILIASLATLSRTAEGEVAQDASAEEPADERDAATSSNDRETRAAPPEARPSPPPPVREAPRVTTPRPPAVTKPAPPQAAPQPAAASPSFNCRHARTRGEVAVCGSPGLARLDRQMAGQFNAAMSVASPAQRDLLRRTRGSFLRFRDSCASEGCMAGAYQDRMREIADILADRWNR